MAEENSWKRAWSLIMGTAENSSDGAQLRILLLLILIISIGLSGYAIYMHTQYLAPERIEATPQPAVADQTRLNAMIQNLNAANLARTQSMEVATSMSNMARYPFVAERITEIETNFPSVIPEVVIIPPFIQVKATMQLEGRSVAVLDIEGEPSGRIYKVGDRFAERKGRITRIAQGRITIIYEDKEFSYTP